MMDLNLIDARKASARAWFETLREEIVAAFEKLEDALPAAAPFADRAAGRFVRTPWPVSYTHLGPEPLEPDGGAEAATARPSRSTDSEIEFGRGLVFSNSPSSGKMMSRNMK